ncbi:MAG: SUMF1/EgtB/PvdO family nonheme iron enzyme [Myxococcota bacterium]
MDGTWRTTLGADGLPLGGAAMPPPRPGRAPGLPERYVDLGHLAVGGIGEVRRVRDTKLGTVLVMKLQRRGAGDTQRRRFEREARLTARLHHPNIVPALDLGVLANGTPWFTMPEVRGRTLRAVMDEGAMPLRRIVELVEGVARALAYAHSERVVHRDIKPQNLMVGRFGEVLVMDFGVALDLEHSDEELDDAVVGTPLYMAPEQARGEIARCGPALDTYALGVILYEVLTGSVPYDGSGIQVWHQIIEGPPPDPADRLLAGRLPPDGLLQLVRHMMVRAPEERPDTLAVANALQAWLDGEERRERARALVRDAEPLAAEVETLRSRVERQRAVARTVLDTLAAHAPLAEKEPGWLLEDEADRLGLVLRRTEAQYLEQLRAALFQDPDCDAAHRGIAAYHRRMLERAEARSDAPEEAVQEQLLVLHDRGEHAAFVEGRSAITLHTEPRGARVLAERLVHRARRWQVAETVHLGVTPLDAASIPHGNWRLRVQSAGRPDVLIPVRLRRGEHWITVPPGSSGPMSIPIPMAVAPDEVYVPAGWYETGGDPDAADPLPDGSVWVPGFAMQRTQVSVRAYRAFLDDLGEAAAPYLPALMPADSAPGYRWEGRWVPIEPTADTLPITLVPPRSCVAYAQWRGARDGYDLRLPQELEWEKAARGADGRVYPWGNGFDPSLANVIQHLEGAPQPVPVGSVPTDVSVYGVHDLGGNMRDVCATAWRPPGAAPAPFSIAVPGDDDLWVVRGAQFNSTRSEHAASRFVTNVRSTTRVASFRCVRSL